MTDENNETGGDFLEDANSISKNWTGEEITPEKMIDLFALYGHSRRAAYLDNLDEQMKTPNDLEPAQALGPDHAQGRAFGAPSSPPESGR